MHAYNITFGARSQHAASTDSPDAARAIVHALRDARHANVLINNDVPAYVLGDLIRPSNTFGQEGI